MGKIPSEMFDSDPSLSHTSLTDHRLPFCPEHLGFPSPAGEEHIGAGSGDVVAEGPAPSSLCDPPFEAAVPGYIPLPGRLSPETPTPSQETQPVFPIAGFAGDGLLTTDAPLSTPPILRAGRNLRLPSFDLLGIRAPHPDRIVSSADNPFSSLGAGPLSKPEDPLHDLSPALSRPHRLGGVGDPPTSPLEELKVDQNRFHHFIPNFTPPAEPGTINWSTFANVTTAAMDSPAKSDPGTLSAALANSTASAAESNTSSQDAPGLGHTITEKSWIEEAKVAISKRPIPKQTNQKRPRSYNPTILQSCNPTKIHCRVSK